ncbi:MAG: hypothetical protein ACSLE2_12900 [Lysobacterales bacterium]
MIGKRILFVACAVAAAGIHPGAEAASGQDGFEACVAALAREISETQGAGVNVRISEETRVHARKLDRRNVYFLDARDALGSDHVVKADCVVDARGAVKSLERLPADAPEAAERSL